MIIKTQFNQATQKRPPKKRGVLYRVLYRISNQAEQSDKASHYQDIFADGGETRGDIRAFFTRTRIPETMSLQTSA